MPAMNARRLIEIVNEFTEHGTLNAYELAARVAAEQKEADAGLVEAAGSPELAEAIRASS